VGADHPEEEVSHPAHPILRFVVRTALNHLIASFKPEKPKKGVRRVVRQEPVEPTNHKDIKSALKSLGYGEREAELAVQALPNDIGLEAGIKQALKSRLPK
jgi:Holliday junction resolvasome RuvABC DNA-binding subunit